MATLKCPRCDHEGRIVRFERGTHGAGVLAIVEWSDKSTSFTWRTEEWLEHLTRDDGGCGYCGLTGDKLAEHVRGVRASLSSALPTPSWRPT